MSVPVATRVVSLVPSLTEAVADLAGSDRLVGRTIYCVEPRGRLAEVPTCGGTKNPDLGAVVSLRPDLVLTCDEENKPEHVAALRDAGLAVYRTMPRSLDDVDALLRDLGEHLGAVAAAAAAREDLADARAEVADRFAGRRAAVLVWREPWLGVGGGVHGNAVLEALGLTNVLADRPDYPAAPPAELAARRPDLVFLPDEPFAFGDADAAELVAAGVVADPARAVRCDGKLLTWYGTRTAASLRRLVAIVAEALGD